MNSMGLLIIVGGAIGLTHALNFDLLENAFVDGFDLDDNREITSSEVTVGLKSYDMDDNGAIVKDEFVQVWTAKTGDSTDQASKFFDNVDDITPTYTGEVTIDEAEVFFSNELNNSNIVRNLSKSV